MSTSKSELELELADLTAAGDWPTLIRIATIVPKSYDVLDMAWSVIDRVKFAHWGQRLWLRWYQLAASFTNPRPRFVNHWSTTETMTLAMLPSISATRFGLARAFFKYGNQKKQREVISIAEGLLRFATECDDPLIGCYAAIVISNATAAWGDFETSLTSLLNAESNLSAYAADRPIIASRMRGFLFEQGWPIIELASDAAAEANNQHVFVKSAVLHPLLLQAWEAFHAPGNDEHELTGTRIELNYANHLCDVDRSDEALPFYNRVVLKRRQLVHNRELPWRFELGRSLSNYAAGLQESDQYVSAHAHATEGIDLINPLYAKDPAKHSDLLAGLLTNRSRTLLSMDRANEALADAATAVDIRRKDFEHRKANGDHGLLLSLSLNVGCLSSLGRSKDAETLIKDVYGRLEADEDMNPLKKQEILASLHLSAAGCHEKAGRSEDAFQWSLKAQSNADAMVAAGLPERNEWTLTADAAVGRRALVAAHGPEEASRLEIADRMLRRVLDLSEEYRSSIRNKVTIQRLEYSLSDVNDCLIEVCHRRATSSNLAEDVVAISEAGRMRSLGDKIALQFDSLDGMIPDELLKELRAVQSDLDLVNDKLYCSDGILEDIRAKHISSEESAIALSQLQASGMEMFRLEKARFEQWLETLFERVKEFVPDFDPEAPETISLSAARELLPEERSAIIHFHVADRLSLATVITSTSANVVRLTGSERGKLQELADAWVAGYSSAINIEGELDHERWRRTMDTLLEEIGTLVLRPILGQLDDGVERLILIPHRELHVFPLHLCLTREGTLLVDKFAIQYCPSLVIMRRCRRRKRDGTSRVFAAKISPVANLPIAELEIESLKKRFGERCTIIGGEGYGRSELMAAAPELGIFHHAGHGSHNREDPLNSALRFGANEDEIDLLSVRDLLEKVRFPKGCLAVLASCEGGVVQADDVDEHFGFPTAFLVAGMNASVSALWNVGDLPAYLLMHRFYHFLSSGCCASQALSNAQNWMRGRRDDEDEGLSDGDAVIAYIEEHSLFSGITSPKVKTYCDRRIEEWEELETPPFESPTIWGAFIAAGADW